jgi:hypothetical protein
MDAKTLKIAAREGTLVQQQDLFVPIEFDNEDYTDMVKGNVVFSARATYYYGEGSKTLSYKKTDAKALVYRMGPGEQRPVILRPHNPQNNRLFGLGVEFLRLFRMSR